MTSAFIEFDLEGQFVRTVAMYSELSDQARVNFKYRTLYRSTPAMLHTVDETGLIVTVTDHWLQKLGYEREEVIGRPDYRLLQLRRIVAEIRGWPPEN